MSLRSLVAVAWPTAFVLAALPVALMATVRVGYGRRARLGVAVGCVGAVAVLLAVPPAGAALRWGLTLVGFAAPIAVSIIAIRYVVDET
ncbi:hypothetical protein [Halosimplex marinum]|uniref:hypothetical protein n=1 Tax=Halosimplex marinum TaxID=3396620 RepID=UPI003F54D38A